MALANLPREFGALDQSFTRAQPLKKRPAGWVTRGRNDVSAESGGNVDRGLAERRRGPTHRHCLTTAGYLKNRDQACPGSRVRLWNRRQLLPTQPAMNCHYI